MNIWEYVATLATSNLHTIFEFYLSLCQAQPSHSCCGAADAGSTWSWSASTATSRPVMSITLTGAHKGQPRSCVRSWGSRDIFVMSDESQFLECVVSNTDSLTHLRGKCFVGSRSSCLTNSLISYRPSNYHQKVLLGNVSKNNCWKSEMIYTRWKLTQIDDTTLTKPSKTLLGRFSKQSRKFKLQNPANHEHCWEVIQGASGYRTEGCSSVDRATVSG